MSQFAWPIYGLDLTSAIKDVWNITEDYAQRIFGLLYELQELCPDNDFPIEIYNPNGEDWYEAYYGIDIKSGMSFDDIKNEYQKKIDDVKCDFYKITKHISVEDTPEKKKILSKLFDELDVRNAIEAGEMINELRDYVAVTPPQIEAIFSF